MMFGEVFKQALSASWWAYSLSSYVVMPWGIWQQNHSKKRWRIASRLRRTVFIRESRVHLPLYTLWTAFISIFIYLYRLQSSQMGESLIFYLCFHIYGGTVYKPIGNYFKTWRWNKILPFICFLKNDTSVWFLILFLIIQNIILAFLAAFIHWFTCFRNV